VARIALSVPTAAVDDSRRSTLWHPSPTSEPPNTAGNWPVMPVAVTMPSKLSALSSETGPASAMVKVLVARKLEAAKAAQRQKRLRRTRRRAARPVMRQPNRAHSAVGHLPKHKRAGARWRFRQA
jgi:hypothetical protein